MNSSETDLDTQIERFASRLKGHKSRKKVVTILAVGKLLLKG